MKGSKKVKRKRGLKDWKSSEKREKELKKGEKKEGKRLWKLVKGEGRRERENTNEVK